MGNKLVDCAHGQGLSHLLGKHVLCVHWIPRSIRPIRLAHGKWCRALPTAVTKVPVKRRGSDVCELIAALGIGRGNSVRHRLRSGVGLRKKQREGCVPRVLFFWPYGLQRWRNSDKGKTYSRSTWPTSHVLTWASILHPSRP